MSTSTGTAVAPQATPVAIVAKKKYYCGKCGHARFAHACTYGTGCKHTNSNDSSCHMIDCDCGGFC